MDLPWLIFLSFVVFLVTCDTQSEADSAEDNTKKYCGRVLSQTLSEICKGNYNQMAELYGNLQRGLVANLEFPFKSRAQATSLFINRRMRRRRRRRRGVSTECCEKPCSFDELRGYCAGSS